MMKPNFSPFFPSITANKLDEIERSAGIKLPDAYRKFILETNGGAPSPCNFVLDEFEGHLDYFYGIDTEHSFSGNSIVRSFDGKHKWKISPDLSENLLTIGSDMFGNLLLLSLSGSDTGYIYFWEHDSGEHFDETGNFSYNTLTLVSKDFSVLLNSAEIDENDDAYDEEE